MNEKQFEIIMDVLNRILYTLERIDDREVSKSYER
jgi:hypothetical protein